MSTIRITASVALAIDYILRLRQGTLKAPKKGEVLPPEWNFVFFTEIRALGIQVSKRFKPDTETKPFQGVSHVLRGGVEYQREVDFRFLDNRIAIVELAGMKFEGDSGGQDNGALWGVKRISYFHLVGPQKLDSSHTNWNVLEMNERPWYFLGRTTKF
jgi:hypothetical protein